MDLGGWGEKYDGLCERLDKLSATLEAHALALPQGPQKHSPQMREWEHFASSPGTATDANGAAVFAVTAARVGFEVLVERISISVGGASSGATVAVFVLAAGAGPLTGGTIDDSALVDWAPQLYGSSPSRSISANLPEIFLASGEQMVLQIAGAVALQQVRARIQGKRREV